MYANWNEIDKRLANRPTRVIRRVNIDTVLDNLTTFYQTWAMDTEGETLVNVSVNAAQIIYDLLTIAGIEPDDIKRVMGQTDYDQVFNQVNKPLNIEVIK